MGLIFAQIWTAERGKARSFFRFLAHAIQNGWSIWWAQGGQTFGRYDVLWVFGELSDAWATGSVPGSRNVHWSRTRKGIWRAREAQHGGKHNVVKAFGQFWDAFLCDVLVLVFLYLGIQTPKRGVTSSFLRCLARATRVLGQGEPLRCARS